MNDRAGDRDLIITGDAPPGGFMRWLPTLVVLTVVSGFVALAWYAYHVGTQSIKDDDLLVVEADKTPIKEKPVDPGGMKFPNQDKTIFETFNGTTPPPAKVERVLPAPEEPLPKDLDTSDTKTWINDKLHKKPDDAKAPGKPEPVISPDSKKPDPAPAAVANSSPTHQVIDAKPPVDDNQTDGYVKKPDDNAEAAPEDKPETKPEPVKAAPAKAEAKPEPKKFEPPKKAAAAADASGSKIQLGAYRSEKEALDAWDKMHKAQPALEGKQPLVVKADLGAKGIYYRLRVGGFSDSAAAKLFCGKMTGGQPCIPVADK